MSARSMISHGQPVPVQILGREMVVPTQPSKRQHFFLSCLDIFWQDLHYNQRLLFYESTALADWFTEDELPGVSGKEGSVGRAALVMEKLKSSLALCLLHYYCWCGRLAKGAEPDHRLFIDCNDAGVEFVEACSDLPISHLAKDGYQMKPFFEQLCQCPDHKGDCLYSSPLLSIQATLFSDGGLALGVAQSHVVADGQALWNFMVSWGECARGVPLSLPPVHNRERLAVRDPSGDKATWNLQLQIKEQDKEEEETDCFMGEKRDEASSSASESHPDPLVQCVLDLPSSAVKKLKLQAGEGYTSFEVTCAHFWQRMTIARQEARRNPIYFAALANFRTRMIPPLPPEYFGNVICFCVATSTVGRIHSETLGATASRIHDSIAQMQEDHLLGFMHWLETHDNRLLSAYSSRPPMKGYNVASSPRFPVYQVDFGWGRPVAVRSAKVPGDGELIFFGGRPGSVQGDVEICTALPATVLRRLLKDHVFLATAHTSPFVDE